MIRLWLSSSSGGGKEDENRAYDLKIDLTRGTSKLTFTVGQASKEATDSVGVLGLSTDETMQGHASSIQMLVAHPWGQHLRDRVLGQDMLLVEALGPDGKWDTLFDGFVSSINWVKQSSDAAYSHRLNIQFEGGHRLLDQGWENWQGVLRAGDSKIGGGSGQLLIENLKANYGSMAPEFMVKGLLTHGVEDLLKFQVRGKTLLPGDYWAYGTGSDWKTDFGFNVLNSINWVLMQQGKLSTIIHSLLEPEIHEFFLTYRDQEMGGEVVSMPTWIFRPHPFPGAPNPGPPDPSGSSMGGDDGRWEDLELITLGTSEVTGCLGVNGARDDSQRQNVFHWAGSSGSPFNGTQFYGKLLIGCWAHEKHIAKYGYSARQVSTSLPHVSARGDWFTKVAPKIVERIAWQDSPLPWLEKQSRNYPWLPSRVAGLHIGKKVTDSSEGFDVTGYLVSVHHEIQVTPDGVKAFSVLGLDRVCLYTDAKGYPDAVRRYAEGLVPVKYASAEQAAINAAYSSPADPALPGSSGSGAVVRPVPGEVTSAYGVKRQDGKTGGTRLHKGVDLRAALGASVKSPVKGTVIEASHSKLNGNFVRVRADESGETHTMCHLSGSCVHEKDKVTAGEAIGWCGSTGTTSTGPHVHWAVKDRNNVSIDPASAKG